LSFLRQIAADLEQAMVADRFRMRNRLKSIQKAEEEGRPFDQLLTRLQDELQKSIKLRQSRAARVPVLNFDEALPISQRRDEIAKLIGEHQVVVVCGETGSGKSTQLPKICLSIGRGVAGMIGHTQPRRIAARSVAARIAEELGSPLGTDVGFKIRFADVTKPETLIKLMTDGILLAETQQDRYLEKYDTIILDEAHERSLNIDFLIGYLKRLLPKRPDLKLIITSATIDAARFAEHFSVGVPPSRDLVAPQEPPKGGTPTIQVSGRTYPVEVLYRPPLADELTGEIDWQRAVADAVEEATSLGPGDVLVFLPTEREIRDVAQTLRGRFTGSQTDILPLYARLSTDEQNRIFHPHKFRRIVLATNVAESSLTVPGITYVVDTGTARVSRYSTKNKVQRLPIEAVSQASADQRKGRCGRIGPGVCIRLYSEDDYLARDRYTTPEIQRTNLASVALQTLGLQLGDVEQFPFLDPPRQDAIRDGYKTLFELGAIDGQRELTPIGRRLATLPCDPRIGRMILAAEDEGCLREVLIIAAALETQDPRERPGDRREAADQVHGRFQDQDSDFLAYLKLWDFIHHLKATLSRSQWKRAVQQNFLSVVRVREWMEVYRQLSELAGTRAEGRGQRAKGGIPNQQSAISNPQSPANHRERYAPIHRALLAGLLSNIAMKGDAHEYKGSGGTAFHLWPGSGVFANKPKWIVAAELVETTKRYLRTVASIDPQWIEQIAPHLVKRSHSDPYFHRKSARVMALEKVSLFGLVLVSGRRVNYGPIDPLTSREIFLQQGLVEGEYETNASYGTHNRLVLERVLQMGAKTRQRKYVVDAQRQFDFFAARLPATVFDGQSFERWRRQAERENAKILYMSPDDLIDIPTEAVRPEEYPDDLATEHLSLKLDYHFEPGAAADGVTLCVPREGVNQLHPEKLGWLVPGLLEERIVALIRTLPKHVRRNLVPAPDVAHRIAESLKFGEGPFYILLAERLTKEAGEPIGPGDLKDEQIPSHLRMNIRVLGEQGVVLAEGRDLLAIKRQLGIEATSVVEARDARSWQRDGIAKWDFGDLPEKLELERSGLRVAVYPTLIDTGDSVSLRLLDNPQQSQIATHAGMRRLFELAATKELRAQIAWLPEMEQLLNFAEPLPRPASGGRESPGALTAQLTLGKVVVGRSRASSGRSTASTYKRDLRDDLADLLADRAFLQGPLPRTEDEFQQRLREGLRELPAVVYDVTKLVGPLLKAHHEAVAAINAATGPNLQRSLDDARTQLARLTPPGFLAGTPWLWLEQYPRYFRAILARVKKLSAGGLSRDVQALAQLDALWQRYEQRSKRLADFGVTDPELVLFRWMIEELRVSLFAQELGTLMPISPQRLEKQWSKVRET
jgi:ATP-dependent helicase HrpA